MDRNISETEEGPCSSTLENKKLKRLTYSKEYLLSLRNSPLCKLEPIITCGRKVLVQITNSGRDILEDFCHICIQKISKISLKCSSPTCESYMHQRCLRNVFNAFGLRVLKWKCKYCRNDVFHGKKGWLEKMDHLLKEMQSNKDKMLTLMNQMEETMTTQKQLIDDCESVTELLISKTLDDIVVFRDESNIEDVSERDEPLPSTSNQDEFSTTRENNLPNNE